MTSDIQGPRHDLIEERDMTAPTVFDGQWYREPTKAQAERYHIARRLELEQRIAALEAERAMWAREALRLSDLLTAQRAIADAAEPIVQALERCMMGGNHIASALIGAIGGDFPERFGTYDEALDALWGQRADTDDMLYEAWMCWNAIMEARATAGGPDWLDAYRAAVLARRAAEQAQGGA